MKSTSNNQLIDSLSQIKLKPNTNTNMDNGERAFSILTGSYLFYKSLKKIGRHPLLGIQGLAAGGLLLYRGATGVCPVYKRLDIDTSDPQAILISETITVNASSDKVYAFWRELSNLPKFMKHLKQVSETSRTESHWVANTPGNFIQLNWKAEITHEERGSYIGWQSAPGAMIENAGKVEFTDTLNQIGTDLHVEINYFPPAGSVGRGITSLFNGVFEKMILEDIRGFKTYVEQADFRTYAGLELEQAES